MICRPSGAITNFRLYLKYDGHVYSTWVSKALVETNSLKPKRISDPQRKQLGLLSPREPNQASAYITWRRCFCSTIKLKKQKLGILRP